MERSATIFLVFTIFLIAAVSMTGCSDSESGDTAATIAVTATTTAPQYTAGDIVRTPSGSTSPAWLIVSYNSGDDSYSRALIFKNDDGTYGYRTTAATEKQARSMLEKLYTVKISHVTVSSVPTAAPTTLTTVETTVPVSTRVTTISAPTTTMSHAKPAIKSMNPEMGEAGTSVITEITGTDLLANLTAKLRRTGETSITASKVTWSSNQRVTVTFDLPNTTKVGAWDVVVTNPNGLSYEYLNYFEISGNKTVVL